MTNLITIPKNVRVVNADDSKNIIVQERKRKVSRYKTPKAVRDKISRAKKEMVVPVLSVSAQLPWLGKTAEVVKANGGLSLNGLRRGAEQGILPSFTGFHIESGGQVKFKPMETAKGLIPNIGVGLLRKSKLLKGTNAKFRRFRVSLS